jgi:hypothetical protein
MKKIISTSLLATLALAMLLPVARQVNAASVYHSILRQGGNPMPTGGGGHYQGGNPMPTGGGGHYQGGNPMPTGGGGH